MTLLCKRRLSIEGFLHHHLKADSILIDFHSFYLSTLARLVETFEYVKGWWGLEFVLLIHLAETIKELDNFILKGVDLYDHTKVFL